MDSQILMTVQQLTTATDPSLPENALDCTARSERLAVTYELGKGGDMVQDYCFAGTFSAQCSQVEVGSGDEVRCLEDDPAGDAVANSDPYFNTGYQFFQMDETTP